MGKDGNGTIAVGTLVVVVVVVAEIVTVVAVLV
jgi:hypothetical protein